VARAVGERQPFVALPPALLAQAHRHASWPPHCTCHAPCGTQSKREAHKPELAGPAWCYQAQPGPAGANPGCHKTGGQREPPAV